MAATTAIERTAEAESRAHWGMLALGWLLYFSFGLISTSLSPLITPIRADLGLSYSQMGLILGAWQLVYIFASLPVGMVIDRIGTKRSLLLGALLVAASGLARSVAVDFFTLLGAVALFGIGGPVISIGLPKLIAEWFTGARRGVASGIYATGASMGSVAALAATNSLILPLTDSWRMTLQVYAGFSLLIAAVWLLLGRSAEGSQPARLGRVDSVRTRDIIANAAVIPVVIIGFAGFFSTHGLRTWLPQIFEDKGFSATDAGLLASLPVLIGIAGSVVILRLAAASSRRTLTVSLLLATALSIVAVALTTGPLLIAGIVLYGFCTGAFMPLLLNTLMEIPGVGARYMGVAAGLFFAVGEIGGFSGPTMLGVLTDATGSFTAGLLTLSGVMVVMILPALRLRSQ